MVSDGNAAFKSAGNWAVAHTTLMPGATILRDIAEVEQDLKSAWRQLNETTDEDLIDSAIYMVKAAEIKYGALIRMLKNSS